MVRRRYFLLDEIPKKLCRVVADKLFPLYAYAPFKDDVKPDILPKPSSQQNRTDFLNQVKDGELHAALASFFGAKVASKSNEVLLLKSGQAKRYTLNNPEQIFK
jgi:hypothetical protein